MRISRLPTLLVLTIPRQRFVIGLIANHGYHGSDVRLSLHFGRRNFLLPYRLAGQNIEEIDRWERSVLSNGGDL
jgi:hypothetical protein